MLVSLGCVLVQFGDGLYCYELFFMCYFLFNFYKNFVCVCIWLLFLVDRFENWIEVHV